MFLRTQFYSNTDTAVFVYTHRNGQCFLPKSCPILRKEQLPQCAYHAHQGWNSLLRFVAPRSTRMRRFLLVRYGRQNRPRFFRELLQWPSLCLTLEPSWDLQLFYLVSLWERRIIRLVSMQSPPIVFIVYGCGTAVKKNNSVFGIKTIRIGLINLLYGIIVIVTVPETEL